MIGPSEPHSGAFAAEVSPADVYPPTFILVENTVPEPPRPADVVATATAVSNQTGLGVISLGQVVVDANKKKYVMTSEELDVCAGVRNDSLLWFGAKNVQTELYRCVSREPPAAWEWGLWEWANVPLGRVWTRVSPERLEWVRSQLGNRLGALGREWGQTL